MKEIYILYDPVNGKLSLDAPDMNSLELLQCLSGCIRMAVREVYEDEALRRGMSAEKFQDLIQLLYRQKDPNQN